MTKLTASDCPRGARCTPLPNGCHEVTYLFKLLNEGRPFVLPWKFANIDFTTDVMIELQVRTRMLGGPECPTEVNLYPAIHFEGCGTYFDVENWPEYNYKEARQHMLHAWHEAMLNLLGSAFQGWMNLKNVPAKVTTLGASITDVRSYVNGILTSCG